MMENKCEECGFYGIYCNGYSSSCKDSKNKEENLPILNVPSKYQPLSNVSMDRQDEKYHRRKNLLEL